MAIQPSDIVFVYSGGSTNQDPNLSLGGDPSAFTIGGDLNNLFANVSNEDTISGTQDHRCFYIFNDNASNTLVDPFFFIQSQIPLGASCVIGITDNDDQQEIRINAPISGGSVDLSFEGDTFTWSHDVDLAVWGENLQTELRALPNLSEVVVLTSVGDDGGGTSQNVFNVNFIGVDGSRSQELLTLVSNSLTGPDTTLTISKLLEGAPINFITTEIAVDTVPPNGVIFQVTDAANPISLQNLRPADGFAIWVQRTTTPGSQPSELDGLTVRITGNAF